MRSRVTLDSSAGFLTVIARDRHKERPVTRHVSAPGFRSRLCCSSSACNV